MVVGAAGYNPKACILELGSKNLCILDDLSLILLEFRLERFIEACCLRCDSVHQRAALSAGEDALIDSLCKLLFAENDTAAGTAKGLMGGAGNDISIGNGVHVKACSDKTCDMSHIYHEQRTDLMSDVCNNIKANSTGICTCAGNDELGAALMCDTAELVVIDLLIGLAYTVRNDVEILTAHIDRAAVSEVAAVAEVHAQDGVAGVEKSKVY